MMARHKKNKNKIVGKQVPEEPLSQDPTPQESDAPSPEDAVTSVNPARPNVTEPNDKQQELPTNHEAIPTYASKKSHDKSEGKSDLRWLWAGLLGGAFVVVFLAFYALLYPGHRVSNYYVNEDPSLLTELLSVHISPSDSISVAKAIQEESAQRNELLQDLLEQKVIVSSDVYASNLSSYYNTLVAVLAAILIIINLVGFFSWRSSANISLEQKRGEMDDAIKNIDRTLENNLEEVFRKNLVVKEKIEAMVSDLIEEGDRLDDDEWEKLHLLLKKYKKKETLESIKADDSSFDGQIGE